jgi:hypothetical protein
MESKFQPSIKTVSQEEFSRILKLEVTEISNFVSHQVPFKNDDHKPQHKHNQELIV